MVFTGVGSPLRETELPEPEPGTGQVRLNVEACAVCRTDLHVVDGELPDPKLPLVLGHQIVGVDDRGRRVGVPWLGWTDGVCAYWTSGRENLCDRARFTGYTIDGGYAEVAVADERYCFELPEAYSDEEAAPLLCAGLIGYRAYRMAGEAPRRRSSRRSPPPTAARSTPSRATATTTRRPSRIAWGRCGRAVHPRRRRS